jgi:hypothetical protein
MVLPMLTIALVILAIAIFEMLVPMPERRRG